MKSLFGSFKHEFWIFFTTFGPHFKQRWNNAKGFSFDILIETKGGVESFRNVTRYEDLIPSPNVKMICFI